MPAGYLPTIAELIARAIVLLVAMTVHEFAHAYVAFRMGDTTARDMGRMTLNPFVNINWMGYLMGVAIGFGFLGSAPVNESRMYNRRWGMLAAVIAGPISNLLLAAVCSIPFWFGLQPNLFFTQQDFIPSLSQLLTMMVELNLILFLFNLLPVFPLDGWLILLKLLPPDMSYRVARYQNEAYILFFILLLTSFVGLNILGAILGPPFTFLFRLLVFRTL